MSRNVLLLFGLTFVGGCLGQARYSESDNQRTINADIGTTFTITLPKQEPAPKPVYSATLLELASVTPDESGNRRVYAFTTRAFGDTTIRIGPDFSIHVRVLSASDRPGMRPPNN